MASLVLAALFFGALPFFWNLNNTLWAEESMQFTLQVASCSTLAFAQKEIQRLKSTNIHAQYAVREDRSNKKWFIVYIDRYKTKEEATRRGNQLIQKGVIKTFTIFPQKVKEEGPPRAKELPDSPAISSKKESMPGPAKNPVYFGPIVIKEEENALRITIMLDRKIFPDITSDKIADGSRLIVTFKNIDRYIVPLEFNKAQSPTLLSFSIAKKGQDCTMVIVLSSTYNYEVSQNYYEKEKIYSLTIGRGPIAEPGKPIKE